MADSEIRIPKIILKEFNGTITNLIKTMTDLATDKITKAHIKRCRSRITTAKMVYGSNYIIKESAEFFDEYSDDIVDRNEDLFLKMDLAEEAKKHGRSIANEDKFAVELVNNIQNIYSNGTKKQQDDIYADVLKLHDTSLEYTVAIQRTAGSQASDITHKRGR